MSYAGVDIVIVIMTKTYTDKNLYLQFHNTRHSRHNEHNDSNIPCLNILRDTTYIASFEGGNFSILKIVS
jgi:hypothetical protein